MMTEIIFILGNYIIRSRQCLPPVHMQSKFIVVALTRVININPSTKNKYKTFIFYALIHLGNVTFSSLARKA